jgi:hypothetical protein
VPAGDSRAGARPDRLPRGPVRDGGAAGAAGAPEPRRGGGGPARRQRPGPPREAPGPGGPVRPCGRRPHVALRFDKPLAYAELQALSLPPRVLRGRGRRHRCGAAR